MVASQFLIFFIVTDNQLNFNIAFENKKE